ncbi:MAG: ABC transporter substrate-binding protein, partial [Alphaproteobacteria bacterium]|nr:ABC transporter substrate-binding protein [Alphaproteobacteria bacterium]
MSTQAQAPQPFKIGLLAGLSGVYGDLTQGQIESMQLAIDDVGGKVLGRPIEIVSADTQNKPDVGASIARRWYDDGVRMITGLDTSSVALAVRKVSQEKGQIDLNVAAGTVDLTGPACSETGAHWTFDTYALAHVTGSAVVKDGGDSWFFVTADYAFGKSLEDETAAVVKAAGAKVLGDVKHPLSTQDFSSFMLQAQASKAKVIGLANAGMDTVNSIKQAAEFGITKGGQRLAGLLIFANDVVSLGLPVAQGLVLTEAFYWDQNDETRAWTKRFRAKKDKIPNMNIAGVYSATYHYLKAVQAAGTDEPKAVMAKMREMPINDATTKNGKLREDGRVIRDMYLFQVK